MSVECIPYTLESDHQRLEPNMTDTQSTPRGGKQGFPSGIALPTWGFDPNLFSRHPNSSCRHCDVESTLEGRTRVAIPLK